ncbi:hypothetical protein CEP07_10350 [Cylindrospermopsis raciborskii S01]|nr:hypothetical protein CEP07_10350 [Cylindrospermopsis raciborskii S01]
MIYFHHGNLRAHIRSFFNHQYLIFGSIIPFIKAIAFFTPPNIPRTLICITRQKIFHWGVDYLT